MNCEPDTSPPPVNGNFVEDGMFLAIPLGFPGVSLPLPASESQLHRLTASRDGQRIYGLTRGPNPHLVQVQPKGTYGYSLDCGAPKYSSEITALATRQNGEGDLVIFATLLPEGARLFRGISATMTQGIQEWAAISYPFQEGPFIANNYVRDIFINPNGKVCAVLLDKTFLLLEIDAQNLTILSEHEIPDCHGRWMVGLHGELRLLSKSLALYIVDWETGNLTMEHQLDSKITTNEIGEIFPHGKGFVFSNAKGNIFAWEADSQSLSWRGRVPLLPILGLCQLCDGRIYLSAGDQIAHWFVLDANPGWAKDLGVPVSTLSTRRYGLQLIPMVVGRDGEIYLGENDFGGHLWIYYPPHKNFIAEVFSGRLIEGCPD